MRLVKILVRLTNKQQGSKHCLQNVQTRISFVASGLALVRQNCNDCMNALKLELPSYFNFVSEKCPVKQERHNGSLFYS